MTDKELKEFRIFLKDHLAAKARKEWKTKLADPEALSLRVFLWELVTKGDEKSLKAAATYLNTKNQKTTKKV